MSVTEVLDLVLEAALAERRVPPARLGMAIAQYYEQHATRGAAPPAAPPVSQDMLKAHALLLRHCISQEYLEGLEALHKDSQELLDQYLDSNAAAKLFLGSVTARHYQCACWLAVRWLGEKRLSTRALCAALHESLERANSERCPEYCSWVHSGDWPWYLVPAAHTLQPEHAPRRLLAPALRAGHAGTLDAVIRLLQRDPQPPSLPDLVVDAAVPVAAPCCELLYAQYKVPRWVFARMFAQTPLPSSAAATWYIQTFQPELTELRTVLLAAAYDCRADLCAVLVAAHPTATIVRHDFGVLDYVRRACWRASRAMCDWLYEQYRPELLSLDVPTRLSLLAEAVSAGSPEVCAWMHACLPVSPELLSANTRIDLASRALQLDDMWSRQAGHGPARQIRVLQQLSQICALKRADLVQGAEKAGKVIAVLLDNRTLLWLRTEFGISAKDLR